MSEVGVLRICMLTHVYPRSTNDHIAPFLDIFARSLTGRGCSVSVIAPHAPGLPMHSRINRVAIYRFRYSFDRFERLAYQGNMIRLIKNNPLYSLLMGLFLLAFLWKAFFVSFRQKAQILHAHWCVPGGLVGAILSILTGRPLIVTVHGSDLYLLQSIPWLRPLGRMIFKKAKAIITVSMYLRKTLLEMFQLDPNKVLVVPMPVDMELFKPSGDPCNREKKVLYAGRLDGRKGITFLIEAFSILDRDLDIRLIIVGEGPDKGNLLNMIQALGIADRVEVRPAISHTQMPELMKSVDIVVLPSVMEYGMGGEGLGLILAEALSCQKAVIGTNVGGIPDIVIHLQTGLIVEEKDPLSLAFAITRLLREQGLAQRLAEQGYKWVIQRCSPEITARQIRDIYAGVL